MIILQQDKYNTDVNSHEHSDFVVAKLKINEKSKAEKQSEIVYLKNAKQQYGLKKPD